MSGHHYSRTTLQSPIITPGSQVIPGSVDPMAPKRIVPCPPLNPGPLYPIVISTGSSFVVNDHRILFRQEVILNLLLLNRFITFVIVSTSNVFNNLQPFVVLVLKRVLSFHYPSFTTTSLSFLLSSVFNLIPVCDDRQYSVVIHSVPYTLTHHINHQLIYSYQFSIYKFRECSPSYLTSFNCLME